MAITVLMLTRYGYSHGVQVAFFAPCPQVLALSFGAALVTWLLTQPPPVPRSWRKLAKSGVFPAN